MKIVLASNSKNRKDLLDMIGFAYEIKKSRKEEESSATNPFEYVAELSKTKALDVLDQLDYEAIIIAADTIITMDDKIYEKPKTKEEAYNNLKEMSGRTTTAITGMTIIDMSQDITLTLSDSVDISFKEISEEDIKWYVENEKRILDISGYAMLGKASIFLEKVNGDYNTLFGISPSKVYEKLQELGYKISDFELK